MCRGLEVFGGASRFVFSVAFAVGGYFLFLAHFQSPHMPHRMRLVKEFSTEHALFLGRWAP